MGNSSGREDEKPLHFVYTKAFFIDKHEVSNAEYMKFIEVTGHAKPTFWEDETLNLLNHPVVGVSWRDAMAYAKWKGHRLPTEAEWEKSARGNDNRLWPWGRKFDKGFFFYYVNVFGEDDNYKKTAPVNYYESGASPFGLLNMSGNVWEWCSDYYIYGYYKTIKEEISRNPRGPEKSTMRTIRGGAWNTEPFVTRTTMRLGINPNVSLVNLGFRCVKRNALRKEK